MTRVPTAGQREADSARLLLQQYEAGEPARDDGRPATRRSSKPPVRLVDPGDVAAEAFEVVRVLHGVPPEPPAVHVKEFAVDRDINLLAGNGGTGKSVLLLTTAVGIVLGHPIFGTLPVHRAGPVLLVLPEDGQAVARMILDAIVEGLALSPNDRALLAEGIVMVTDESVVNITRDTRRLQRTALDHGAVAIFADPLRNLLGGADENDNGVAGATCDTIRRDLCRGADVTVILAHHNRKPGKDALAADSVATVHDLRGGGGWANGSRLVLGVSKKANRITITGLKANRIKPDLRHELDLEIVADPENPARWLSLRLTDANAGASSDALTPGIGRALNANEHAALGCVDDRQEPGRRLSWGDWLKLSSLNANTLKSIKTRLLDARLADVRSTGRKTRNGSPEYSYGITDDGRQALVSGWVNERSKGEGVSNG